ncbi:MAG: 3'-5' exonuclease [Flavobacteriales bacterium]|nr:3'-5' exonuclease [Flavobacteriales bacterium]
MKLKLTKPLAFFDLETTGLNIATDRIVEISIVKIMPNGDKEIKTKLINPTIPISAESVAIHGITEDKIKDKATFKEVANELNDFIKGCDLAGFNSNRFDVPLIAEEFLRAGIDFNVSDRKLVDVQNIFHKMEQRTLVAAYKFYCDKDLTNAHSAEADTTATYEILEAQIAKYSDLEADTDFLSEFSQMTKNADLLGRFVYDENNVVVFNFGKHKGKAITEVLEKEPGYYGWMMNGDFPLYTKKVMKDIKAKMKPTSKPLQHKPKPNKPTYKKPNKANSEPTEDRLNMLKNKFNS